MQVNVRLLGVYVLCLALSFLAGIYFGPTLLFIFIFLILLPLALVTMTIIPFAFLRVEERWGKSMPVRGDTVPVSMVVVNPSLLPAHGIRVELTGMPGQRQTDLLTLHLPPTTGHTTHLALRYEHRGVYRIGVKAIRQSDPLGFLHLSRVFEPQEFRVYPKLYEIRAFSTVVEDILGRIGGRNGHGAEDPALFMQLREYREGESIRHISWRKFASTGKPFLREFERQQRNGAALYLDTRRGTGTNRREQEDTSLEIFLAIGRYLIRSGIPVTCRAPGNSELEQLLAGSAAGAKDFTPVLREAIDTRFDLSAEFVSLLAADARAGLLERKAVIVVTHRFDEHMRSACDNGIIADLRLVLNVAGMTPEERKLADTSSSGVFGDQVELYLIDDAEKIPSVLEDGVHERHTR